jgi:hypothetical protein
VTPRVIAALVLAAAIVGARTPAQTEISDAVLERVSAGRTVDIGLLSTGGGVTTLPLERPRPPPLTLPSRRSPWRFAPTRS